MSRVTTEARSRAAVGWISGHVSAERRYRPPPGRGICRQPLRRTKKELAGRFYQFLSSHAAIGSHLHRLGRTDSDRCWSCGTGQRMSRSHLVARCRAWTGQARVMWERIGRLCEWERPRAPSVRRMFEDVRATPAVLSFLRDTRVGKMATLAPWSPPAEGGALFSLLFSFVPLFLSFPFCWFFLCQTGKQGALL